MASEVDLNSQGMDHAGKEKGKSSIKGNSCERALFGEVQRAYHLEEGHLYNITI